MGGRLQRQGANVYTKINPCQKLFKTVQHVLHFINIIETVRNRFLEMLMVGGVAGCRPPPISLQRIDLEENRSSRMRDTNRRCRWRSDLNLYLKHGTRRNMIGRQCKKRAKDVDDIIASN